MAETGWEIKHRAVKIWDKTEVKPHEDASFHELICFVFIFLFIDWFRVCLFFPVFGLDNLVCHKMFFSIAWQYTFALVAQYVFIFYAFLGSLFFASQIFIVVLCFNFSTLKKSYEKQKDWPYEDTAHLETNAIFSCLTPIKTILAFIRTFLSYWHKK